MPVANSPDSAAYDYAAYDYAAYDYAIIRVVPLVERGEFINAGVILFCRTKKFLAARLALREDCLLALAPHIDVAQIQRDLALFSQICAGAGPIGQLDQTERFHWLVAPRSTIIQTSPVHSGLCDDPDKTLDHLVKTLVAAP